jgi:hypothetical protein
MLSAPVLRDCYEHPVSTTHDFVLDFEKVTFGGDTDIDRHQTPTLTSTTSAGRS